MRHPLRRLLPVLLTLPCALGCRATLYPAARAFGGAKESELRVSREAFAAMKTGIRRGSVVVLPTLVTDRGGKPAWSTEPTAGVVGYLRREICPSAVPSAETPDLPAEPLDHNQLRYQTRRGREYAGWVAAHPPAGEYFLFTEVFRGAAGDTILAGQIFVIDAAGRVAYSRHYNSHWFDPASMPGVDAFLEWMLKELLADLARDPDDLFPPYGVG